MNNALNRKTAVIWDLDGTLLDSYEIIVSSLYKTCSEFGISCDKQDILKEIITYTANDFIARIAKESGIEFSVFKQKHSEINESEKLNIRPIKNAVEILRWLNRQGIPCFVFTHRGNSTETVLKNTGLYDFFREIITGKDGFRRKPDPDAINYLVQKYELAPDNTWYIGDRTIDIECAVNAGIRSILYLPEQSVAKPTGKETFIVKDLLEIRDIFSGK